MADKFDPYEEWLGISPLEPPPNHYRLLGLRPFEDSPDVIQQAVIRLMARVKGLSTGHPESVSRRVLSDLAAARDCLVNRQTKANYDRQLRERSAGAPSPETSTGPPSGQETPLEPTSGTRLQSGDETLMFIPRELGEQSGDKPAASGEDSSFSLAGSIAPPSGGSKISASGESKSSPSGESEAGASGLNLAAGAAPAGKTSKARLIGDYVLTERIGIGGMGQVFKARHRKLNRTVAVKILPPQSIKSIESVRRFYREVESAAKLNHPNIVAALDAGEQNGIHFLVMEFVDGRDLSQILKQEGPLPIEKVIDYARQAAVGLAYAHREGIVHRDIKPANLLLDREGRIKILDMGLASNEQSISTGSQMGLTTTGQIMGTVDYMSPEQAEDTHQADGRSDVYSLGCTMYRLCTNEVPFSADTIMKKILAHRESPIPSLADVRPDMPPSINAVVQKMLAKKPADRYQTMEELIGALDRCSSESIEPRPTGSPMISQSAGPSVSQGSADANTSVTDLVAPNVGPSTTPTTIPMTKLATGNDRAGQGGKAESPVKKSAPPQSATSATSQGSATPRPTSASARPQNPKRSPPDSLLAKPLAASDSPNVRPTSTQPRNWLVVGSIVVAMTVTSMALLWLLGMLRG